MAADPSPASPPTPTPRDGPPPFGVRGPTTASWREQVLVHVAELRFLITWLRERYPDQIGHQATRAIDDHLDAAVDAAAGEGKARKGRRRAAVGGASVERAIGHLDAAETSILRMAPDGYIRGQLPSLLAQVRSHLQATDPRLLRLEAIAVENRDTLSASDREAVLAAFRSSALEARREVTRLRSFRNVLYLAALVLTVCAATMAVIGLLWHDAVPLCFTPGEVVVVCPLQTAVPRVVATQDGGAVPAASGTGPSTVSQGQQATALDRTVRDTTSRGDIAIVEIIGLIAGAVAGAVALRGIQGTSTPYSLPIALAFLKLPTGAITALLGLLLMRAQFVPGLSALDSSAQILGYAIVFGSAQQLFTRLVDQRAQGVLADVGAAVKATDPAAPPPPATPMAPPAATGPSPA
ncbi:MAG TPA: hypothetical protein VK501_02625 [Baekduia sp.]|uniref:hypothetical protein n=1 Tax=Baekduia sp. TaxID=2600305 RepID=UPI002C12EB8E|nr:hypothetical protein [Baekduia sp.]HMJ32786.1 hypothetical protein [Baekduia sp.]